MRVGTTAREGANRLGTCVEEDIFPVSSAPIREREVSVLRGEGEQNLSEMAVCWMATDEHQSGTLALLLREGSTLVLTHPFVCLFVCLRLGRIKYLPKKEGESPFTV